MALGERSLSIFMSVLKPESCEPVQGPKRRFSTSVPGFSPTLPRVIYVYISDIFIKHRSKYNLRQSDFSAARYNTVIYGKHSLRHLGSNLWGKLSPDLREVTTLKCFKNKIRTLDIVTLMDNGCKCCHLCNSQTYLSYCKYCYCH